jgi:hypothetical protein
MPLWHMGCCGSGALPAVPSLDAPSRIETIVGGPRVLYR